MRTLLLTLMSLHKIISHELNFLGAFGSHPGHDAHIHSTLSAIQILATQGAMDRLNVGRVTNCAC